MSPAHDLIERLYSEHHHAVLRFARARDYDLAEDVVSETFAIAMRRADAIPAGAERAWLCGVADNVLRNLRRKEARAASLPGVLQPHSSTTTPPHDPPVVGPALNELPDTERAVLALTAFEGLTSGEAADRLGLSPGSTRNAMVRARRNLAVQLAGFGVLLLIPVLFFVLRDRAGSQAPQAQQLARALGAARALETDATVSRGGTSRQYSVLVDRAAGLQRIILPGGQVAEGPVGGELRIVPQAGVSAQERRETRRANAPALAALQTITSGDLQRFLAQARRAGVQQRTTGSGASQVTVVQGEYTLTSGGRVELRVTLGGEPAALRQLKIRPAGDPSAPWTTVDVSRWQVELPAAGAPDPGGAQGDPTAGAASPKQQPSTTAASGSWTPKQGGTSSRTRPRNAWKRKRISPATAARNRRELSAVPVYAGPTGEVLHRKGRTVSYRMTDNPHETLNYTVESESWEEIGGGHRYRSVERSFKPEGGAFAGAREFWSSPRLMADIPRGDPGAAARNASFAIFCTPRVMDENPREDLAVLRDARSHLDDLPSGPRIDGHKTRRVEAPFAGMPAASGTAMARFYVDASTGVPRQFVFVSPRTGKVQFKTTYTLWEVVPAGGSGAELQGTPPEQFLLSKLECTDPAAATTPAVPTTP